VLVAFHGRGEALRSPERGARGWLQDYAIDRAIDRLGRPPLVESDFLGFVTPERLAAHNQRLATQPYGGLIVVCPYLADVLRGPSAFDQGPALADFVVDRVLPRVVAETPAAVGAGTVGVDGVSLGGRAALLVGLLRPEAFGSLGALQPAIDRSEAPRFTALATAAHRKNPSLALRLLTSDDDYFRAETEALAAAWQRTGVPSRLDVVVGPHDYAFNRGPGSYEMLLYHDGVLGERAGPRE
jgi:dienelactone hydrolase